MTTTCRTRPMSAKPWAHTASLPLPLRATTFRASDVRRYAWKEEVSPVNVPRPQTPCHEAGAHRKVPVPRPPQGHQPTSFLPSSRREHQGTKRPEALWNHDSNIARNSPPSSTLPPSVKPAYDGTKSGHNPRACISHGATGATSARSSTTGHTRSTSLSSQTDPVSWVLVTLVSTAWVFLSESSLSTPPALVSSQTAPCP